MNRHKLSAVDMDRVTESPPDGRPLGEIARDIMNHVSEIVRSEFRLVSLEVKQEAAELKAAAISLAIGNVLLLYGGLFLLLGIVYALSIVWPAWLASLVVGAGVAIAGAVLAKVGANRLKRSRLKRTS
jgi:uncharacterized membrane protein YqjE